MRFCTIYYEDLYRFYMSFLASKRHRVQVGIQVIEPSAFIYVSVLLLLKSQTQVSTCWRKIHETTSHH